MERDPFLGLIVIDFWVNKLLGMVIGCFELMILAMYYFWCTSSDLFLFAFLIETILSQRFEGSSEGLFQLSIHTTILGVLLMQTFKPLHDLGRTWHAVYDLLHFC